VAERPDIAQRRDRKAARRSAPELVNRGLWRSGRVGLRAAFTESLVFRLAVTAVAAASSAVWTSAVRLIRNLVPISLAAALACWSSPSGPALHPATIKPNPPACSRAPGSGRHRPGCDLKPPGGFGHTNFNRPRAAAPRRDLYERFNRGTGTLIGLPYTGGSRQTGMGWR
jgi:hypothetical protein